MSLAVDRDATHIWVVNVGDMKPLEMDIEFFITYGWNSSRWSLDAADDFTFQWAKREFSLSDEDAADVVSVVGNMTRYLSRRKPELLNATTYSLINYREYVPLISIIRLVIDYSPGLISSSLNGRHLTKPRRGFMMPSLRRPRQPSSSSSITQFKLATLFKAFGSRPAQTTCVRFRLV